MKYQDFLKQKSQIHVPTGIEKDFWLHDALKPHQHDIVSWALRRGRAAIFAGTGLGKTLMEMNWSQSVMEYTNKPVLLLAPLAVSAQIALVEAPKFNFKVIHAYSDDDIKGANIYATNYEKLDKFDLSKFGGIVLDESSILKNHSGKYRTDLIKQCKQIPFRLAATATPAPNDFMELGNHSEFLGIMSYTDMLATFFVHDGGSTQNWRLRGHAEDAFWKWMCTWSVMLRKPSDLGYSDDGYNLPELHQIQHTVGAEYEANMDTGMLFPLQAETMQERLKARKATVKERVEHAASITPKDGHFVWWCNLNDESDALAKSISDSVEIRGSDTEKSKEEKLIAFSRGDIQRVITKSKVCGFGIHSPPFEGLYRFSNSDRDISNNDTKEGFWQHYGFLIREILRITKPGRNHSVHVMQLPSSKGRDGFIGMRDFRGETIRAYQEAGWHLVSEVCIWKDPVVAQQRTKSIRLLHKQLVKDSTLSGQGLADYVLTFRKPGENKTPVAGALDIWVGEGDGPSRDKWTDPNDSRNWFSIECWQKLASPVWMDINQTRTLQYRNARDEKDEQHISPLQLDVIERCIQLWSNYGETVFTPFLGIGSEVYGAVEMGRFGVGIELKPSYFSQAVKNLEECHNRTDRLL